MKNSNWFASVVRGAALTFSLAVALQVGNASSLGMGASYDIFFYGATGTSSISHVTSNNGIAAGNDLDLLHINVSKSDAPFSLIAGNNLILNQTTVDGGVAYGGTATIKPSVILSDSPVLATPIDFAAAGADLVAASQSFANLAANGTAVFQAGGYTLTGTNAVLNVFHISAENLSSSNFVNVSAPVGSIIIVNVDGSAVSLTNEINFTGLMASNVILNFNDAATVNFSNINIPASVFAPNANISFSDGQLAGSLIGKSGKVSNVEFGGVGFIEDSTVNTVATPEPATYALMGATLIGIALAQRKRVLVAVRR